MNTFKENNAEIVERNKNDIWRSDFDRFKKFKETHNRIKSLSASIKSPDFSEKWTQEYEKIKKDTKLSWLSTYQKLLQSWIDSYKKDPNFDPEKLEQFTNQLISLINALSLELRENNDNLENWLEMVEKKSDIDEALQKAEAKVNSLPNQDLSSLFASWQIKPAEWATLISQDKKSE